MPTLAALDSSLQHFLACNLAVLQRTDSSKVLEKEDVILFFHPNLDPRVCISEMAQLWCVAMSCDPMPLEVSIIETKHLMEISDFDQDGVLSKHLGSVELCPRPDVG